MGKGSMTLITTILDEEEGSYPRRKETVAQKDRSQLPEREGDSYSEGKETDI